MAGRLWSRWMGLAQAVGDFQSRLILTLLYFTLVVPIALLVRLRGRGPRSLPPGRRSAWTPREAAPSTIEQARRQY